MHFIPCLIPVNARKRFIPCACDTCVMYDACICTAYVQVFVRECRLWACFPLTVRKDL